MLTLLDSQALFKSLVHTTRRDSKVQVQTTLATLFVCARSTFPSLSVKSTRTSHTSDEATTMPVSSIKILK